MSLYKDDELKAVLEKQDARIAAYREENGLDKIDEYNEKTFEYAKEEEPKATMEHFKNVYRTKEFTQVMNEYFDIMDTKTRQVLLAVDEADQDKIMVSLTSKLYDAIMDKVDDIDFGDIPESKGDINKVSNINKVWDCLNIMKDLLKEYKQPTDPIDTIMIAINNIADRKDMFTKAFRYKIELPMVVYNTMVLSIISATSYMITTTIQFIKTPTSDSFDVTLDRVSMTKSKQHLVYQNLKKFNDSCRSGELDRCMEYTIRNNLKNLTGIEFGVIAGGIAIVGLIFAIIPMIRELIFFTYYSRVRVSEYFDAQATLLQMNVAKLEANKTLDKVEKEKIIKKQSNIADFFKKIANAIAVKCKKGEKEATDEIVASSKKYKIDDVVDSVPDSAGSVLF